MFWISWHFVFRPQVTGTRSEPLAQGSQSIAWYGLGLTVVSPEQIIHWANRIPSLRTWDENHRKNELNEQEKGNTPRRQWDGGQGTIPATLLLRCCLEPKTCSLRLCHSLHDYFPQEFFLLPRCAVGMPAAALLPWQLSQELLSSTTKTDS